MLSNTINSPHYATFRNTVIEPPRQLDKSSSNPINNCMQKQKIKQKKQQCEYYSKTKQTIESCDQCGEFKQMTINNFVH